MPQICLPLKPLITIENRESDHVKRYFADAIKICPFLQGCLWTPITSNCNHRSKIFNSRWYCKFGVQNHFGFTEVIALAMNINSNWIESVEIIVILFSECLKLALLLVRWFVDYTCTEITCANDSIASEKECYLTAAGMHDKMCRSIVILFGLKHKHNV